MIYCEKKNIITKMVTATVVGASGYLGAELIRILINHPKVDDIIPVSQHHARKSVSAIHRNLYNIFDRNFEDLEISRIDSDIAFFASHPGEWFKEIPELLEKGVKVITLGGKFRIKDIKIDKEIYGGYENQSLLDERVYGLPELFRGDIKKARFITNPGCYPTSAILGIAPLAKEKVDLGKVVITSISGSSGAGSSPSEFLHHPEVSGNVKPYSVINHRHRPEMEFILREIAGQKAGISFTPMVGDFSRGIISNITIFSEPSDNLQKIYEGFYKDEFFVRVLPEGEEILPNIRNILCTNFCDVKVLADKNSKRVLVISVLDNITRGGSGQAVQNMNIMFGFDERAGLNLIAGHL